MPNLFSKALSRWLTADWVIEFATAAWVKPLSFTTSQNNFSVSMSILMNLFARYGPSVGLYLSLEYPAFNRQ
jgi:hypothetical protein